MTTSKRIEWGLRVDCAKNRCEPPHDDDGEVLLHDGTIRGVTRLDNHAVTVVRRVVREVSGCWAEQDGDSGALTDARKLAEVLSSARLHLKEMRAFLLIETPDATGTRQMNDRVLAEVSDALLTLSAQSERAEVAWRRG